MEKDSGVSKDTTTCSGELDSESKFEWPTTYEDQKRSQGVAYIPTEMQKYLSLLNPKLRWNKKKTTKQNLNLSYTSYILLFDRQITCIMAMFC